MSIIIRLLDELDIPEKSTLPVSSDSLLKSVSIDIICDIISNVLTTPGSSERKLPPTEHLTFVKTVLMDEGEEQRIHSDEAKGKKSGALDAKRMWEDTKQNILPNYEKTFWQKLTKH